MARSFFSVSVLVAAGDWRSVVRGWGDDVAEFVAAVAVAIGRDAVAADADRLACVGRVLAEPEVAVDAWLAGVFFAADFLVPAGESLAVAGLAALLAGRAFVFVGVFAVAVDLIALTELAVLSSARFAALLVLRSVLAALALLRLLGAVLALVLGVFEVTRLGVPLIARVGFSAAVAGFDVSVLALADARAWGLAAAGLPRAGWCSSVTLLAALRTTRPALRSVESFFFEEALAALSFFKIIALS